MESYIFWLVLGIIFGGLAVYLAKNNKKTDLTSIEASLSTILEASLSPMKTAVIDAKKESERSAEESSKLMTLLTKGGPMAGKFGESTLKVLLESSGFKKGDSYFEQDAQDGSIPDITVKLPDNRFVVIDSKVSFSAFNDYINAEGELNKQNYYDKHIASVKKHIKDLANKDYTSIYKNKTLKMVIMFMPADNIYSLAVGNKEIIELAATKKVTLTSPTTILVVLQIIRREWSNRLQSENMSKIVSGALDIYDKARLVADSFMDFEKSLVDVNKHIITGKERVKKLVNKVENMRTIGGIEPTKEISDKVRVVNKE